MKFLLIAALALSASAFADTTMNSTKSSTTKTMVPPVTASEVDRTGTMNDGNMEIKKESSKTETMNRSQNMDDTTTDSSKVKTHTKKSY